MSGASAVFILDGRGKVILWRNYRGEVPPSVAERFMINVVEESDEANIKPVFVEDGICYCWIKYGSLFFLGVSRRNSNAIMILTYLYKLAEVLKDYFKSVEEESIRDNFVLTYELMDEMMDNGIPQTTEVKILREYIKTESFQFLPGSGSLHGEQTRPPTAITNAVSWRPEGIRHKKNEVFLDVVERLNLLVSANGTVLRSEILGSLKMKTFLSGMPELKLGLNDKLMLDAANRGATAPAGRGAASGSSAPPAGRSVEMEDIKFHQCVRLSRFENDRTISFIPPDGEFELMSYRLSTHVKPLIWVETVVDRSSSRTRIEYMVKAKSNFKSRSVANNVEILIPVPSDVDTPNFKTSIGSVKYLPGKDAMLWSIKQFAGQKDFIMTATFGLPSVASETRDAYQKRPINVKFEIPYFTVSGVTVRYLKIVEKSGYQALPWVRYITQNGEYQLRMT
jgi:AP-1 complex subunit mu